jgi:hypothetical protein
MHHSQIPFTIQDSWRVFVCLATSRALTNKSLNVPWLTMGEEKQGHSKLTTRYHEQRPGVEIDGTMGKRPLMMC